ncbi:MAG: alpha/beta fold hydrolase, partial [Acidimicrobiales bacterium]
RAQEAYRTGDLARRMSRYHRDADSTFAAWADVWLSPDFDHWSIEDRLARIACPVLLVQGTEDRYGSLAQLDAIERGVRGPLSRLVLPGCGHAPHNERPRETLEAVTHFLRCRVA